MGEEADGEDMCDDEGSRVELAVAGKEKLFSICVGVADGGPEKGEEDTEGVVGEEPELEEIEERRRGRGTGRFPRPVVLVA